MADDIDLANDLMDIEVTQAIKRMREEAAKAPAKGSKECVECGDELPPGRTKLGFKLCIPCAEQAERKKSLFA